jgi:hypothetical protein
VCAARRCFRVLLTESANGNCHRNGECGESQRLLLSNFIFLIFKSGNPSTWLVDLIVQHAGEKQRDNSEKDGQNAFTIAMLTSWSTLRAPLDHQAGVEERAAPTSVL